MRTATMPEPRVSVIVSTHDRPERLARLLAALRSQTLAPREFEIVVVDDGSGPATAELLAAAGAGAGPALRATRHTQRRGPAAGRNTGWRLARSRLVAFTDDDCTPAPGWLSALLEMAGAHPGAIVQGATRPDPAELPGSRLMATTVESVELGPQYQTCNIAYPRALLDRLGGFDERLHAGEDTDLAWRAIEAGLPIVFAPQALVHHAVQRLRAGAWLTSGVRWGDTAHVFAAHPKARQMLYARVFWNVWHMLLLRSLLALAAPAWLRRFVLARHLRALRRRARGLGSGPWAVPGLLLYDAVETAAIIRGAARHRTPLL